MPARGRLGLGGRGGALRLLALPLLVAVGAAGCRALGDERGLARRPIDDDGARRVLREQEDIRGDRVAFLRSVRDRCRTLQQYTLLFTRIERRGIFNALHGPEHIRCWYRRAPYSVRMLWLDPNVKYGESAYVAGANGDRVRFVPRNGLFGLPPLLTKVDLMTPVIWGEAKRPLNEWGLEKLMDATLDSFERSPASEAARLEYRGVAVLPALERFGGGVVERVGDRAEEPVGGGGATSRSARRVHWFQFRYVRPEDVASVQDLYVDVESGLPAGTLLSFADGRLDAAYYYDELDAHVSLSDDDFLMSVERERRSGSE